jgi:hypothetical protein
MSDIIDINVAQTVEEVTINVTEEVIQVNINTINGGGGGIESVVAGTNITVDNTDPLNPIINANADAVTSVNSDTGAVIVDLESVLSEDNVSTLPIDANIIYSNGNLIADEAGTLTSNSFLILKQSPTQQKTLLSGNYINANQQEYILPDKSVGTYFLATTDDIPSPITIDATPTDGSSNAVSSNGVFDALALKQDIVSGVSDTEIGYLDGVTSAIQTQLNNRVNTNKFIKGSRVRLNLVSGVQVFDSVLIPANTYQSGDAFSILFSLDKSPSGNNVTFTISHDTVINGFTNIIGNNLIFNFNELSANWIRYILIDNTTARCFGSENLGANFPNNRGQANKFFTFNPTVDNYITLSGILIPSNDITLNGLCITPI